MKKLDYLQFEENRSEKNIAKFKIDCRRYIINTTLILLVSLALAFFISIYFYILTSLIGIILITYVLGFFFPNLLIKKVNFALYKEKLPIYSNIPENYESLGVIYTKGRSYEEAFTLLLKEAYKFKPDALMDLKHNFNIVSNFETKNNLGVLHTKNIHQEIHTLQALVILFK